MTFEFSNFGQKCWFFEFLDVSNFVPSSKQVYIMLFNLISYPCFDVSFEFRNNLFPFVTVREFEITLKIGSDSDILNLDRFSKLRDSWHDFPDLTSSFYNILQSATTSFIQQQYYIITRLNLVGNLDLRNTSQAQTEKFSWVIINQLRNIQPITLYSVRDRKAN